MTIFGVGGRVLEGGRVQCPFHGWIFAVDSGQCTRIPYDDGSIPSAARLTVWPVIERNNLIYAWHHAEGDLPHWDVPEVNQVETREWPYRGRTEHEINCHIQEIPENGADIAHLHFLHLAGVNKGNDITRIDMDNEQPTIRHVWDGDWQANGHIGTMQLTHFMTAFGFRVPFTYTRLKAEQIGPGIVHMHFDFGKLGRGVVLQSVTPEERLLQRVRFVMYASLSPLLANFFLWSEATHFERDLFIWTHKRYISRPLLCKNDGPIGKHRRWYSQFYSPNSRSPLPTLDW